MSRAARLLFLANSLQRGGAERVLFELASRLPGDGYAVKVLCLNQASGYADELDGHVPVEALGLQGGFRIRDLRRLRSVIAREKPALVQCFHVFPNRWGPFAARLAGVRCSVQGLQNSYYWHGPRQRVLDRLMFSMASHGVCCSEAVRRFHVQTGKFPASKVSVVPNGVDVARLATGSSRSDRLRAEFGLPSDALLVGTIARMIEQKGHRYLLEAAGKVLERFPQAIFVLAGDGQLRPHLEQEARDLKIDRHVVFLGVREDVAAILTAFDLFVLPSLWEGMPLAVLEAMAAAMPVVASAVDGVVEVVDDGHTGLLVPPKDAAALADAICNLLGDPVTRERMGCAGRKRVEERFSADAMVDGYRRVYERLLELRAA